MSFSSRFKKLAVAGERLTLLSEVKPMALLNQDPGDPGEKRVSAGPVGGAETQLEQRLLRDGRQVIARGALICPACELPMPGSPAVSAALVLHCGWCGHSAPARDLLRTDIRDTGANAVALVARIAQARA